MELYKILIEILNKVKIKYEEITSLQYGDVIWCEVEESDKYKFEGTHRLRPFTFLYKDDKYIYALSHTHHRNVGVLGHYVDEKFRSVLVNNIVKIEYKQFKNRFNGKYDDKQLSKLSRHLFEIHKNDKNLANVIKKHISLIVEKASIC